MSQGYSNRIWACPFFSWDERCTVHCEGGTRIRFAKVRTYTGYVSRFCCDVDSWDKCSVAAALIKQYDEEDNDARREETEEEK